MIKKQNFYFKSSNKTDRIHGECWIPENKKVRAVVQIAHGMVEFVDRYDDFARFLCKHGIAVVGNDHLGHGRTAASEDDWGYLGENGFAYMVDDMEKLRKHFSHRFPNVPYHMLGHSMGSFLTRYYLVKYGKRIDGAIIMGTGYHPVPVALFGKCLTKVMAAVKGWRYRSTFVTKIVFGAYNKGFDSVRTDYDWISRDEAVVDKYMAEPACQFIFTLNGYHELFKGISFISNKKNVDKMPKHLPILFVSGDADPVGSQGDGVEKIYDMFALSGMENLDILFYKEARHEVLNETNRKEVYHDLYEWLNKEISLKR